MNKILEGRCGAIFVRIADVADFTCLVRFCRRIGLEAVATSPPIPASSLRLLVFFALAFVSLAGGNLSS